MTKRIKKIKPNHACKSKKVRAAEVDIRPIYYFQGGLRKVTPYDYIFSTYAKERWLNRTVLDVFDKEFNFFRSNLYYQWAIERGDIVVNGIKVGCDYLVQNGDLVETKNHRHEPPVKNQEIEIIFNGDELLVVSKPSSFPVHPTGKYRHNSLLHILKYEHNMENDSLHFVNRIDRLTSGLVLIAKNKTKAAEMGQIMTKRYIKKTYLARVKGKFPDGIVECNEPILPLSQKLGIQIVSPDGKPCSTTFTRLSFNGITSVVKCTLVY